MTAPTAAPLSLPERLIALAESADRIYQINDPIARDARDYAAFAKALREAAAALAQLPPHPVLGPDAQEWMRAQPLTDEQRAAVQGIGGYYTKYGTLWLDAANVATCPRPTGRDTARRCAGVDR